MLFGRLPIVVLDTTNTSWVAGRGRPQWRTESVSLPGVDGLTNVTMNERVAAWIRRVHGQAAVVVWAQPWEPAVATHIARMFDLPPVPALTCYAKLPPYDPDTAQGVTEWAHQVICRDEPRHTPVVWCDDGAAAWQLPDPPRPADVERWGEYRRRCDELFRGRQPGSTLTVVPNRRGGLSDIDLRRINRWIGRARWGNGSTQWGW